MITSYLSRLKNSNLSIRLLVLTIACGLFFTLLASGVQLYFEYHRDVAAMHNNFTFIEDSYVPAITASSYLVDNEQLMIQIKGVLQIQGIEFLQVTEERGSELFQLHVGNPEISYPISKEYKLQYQKTADQIFYVGTLLVKASLAQTYHRLKERAGIILLTNGTGLIMVAFCILLIFEFAVTRHLVKMADFTNKLDINELDQELNLDRRAGKVLRPDELDHMAATINDLRIRLKAGITERKQAEEALRKSEAQYRSLIQKIQAAVVVHNADTRIIACNPKALELLGLTEDQMMGKAASDPDWAFLGTDGLRLDYKDYPVNQVMTTRKPLKDMAAGVYHPDKDDQLWVLINADPVFDEKREIQQVIVTFMDITERKRSEQVLKDSETRHRELFVSNPHPMWIYDLDSLAFLDVNNAAMAHYGYSREEFLSMTIKDIRPADDVPRLLDNVNRVSDGLDKAGIWRHIRKDGSAIDVEITSHVLQFGQHRAEMVLVNDITERKQAEEALHQSEAQNRLLLEQVHGIVWTVDKNLRFTSSRGAGLTSIGLKPDQVVGQSLQEVIGTDDSQAIAAVQKAFAGKSVQYEEDWGGTPWESRVEPLRDPDGQIVGSITMSLDITERMRAEEELARHRDHLEELVKERTSQLEQEIEVRKNAERQIAVSLAEKEVLLREIHHRVKNNLNTVSNLLYLQSRTIEDDQITEAFQESRNRIQTMARVHELLYHSESLTRIDMNDYLKELMADLVETNPTAPVAVKADASDVRLEIDQAIPCGLIVTELVSNSLKYAFSTDTPEDRISIRLSAEGDDCQLVVVDNGCGLPDGLNIEEACSLGLRLVGMLTRQLHGTLEVQSAPGQGTLFAVSFKASEPRKEEE